MTAKNDDGLFGGMFDINGDGKTDLIEKSLEYHYLEEMAKETEESGTGYGTSVRLSRRASSAPSKQPDTAVSEDGPEPERVTREQYDSRASGFIKDCVLALIVFLIHAVPACVVVWAAADRFDPNDRASVILTTAVFLIGAFFLVCFISGAVGIVGDSWSRMKTIQRRYEEQQGGEEQDRDEQGGKERRG